MLANKYHVLETLGCGAHGRVSKVQRTFDGALFALKQIRLDGTPAEHAAALNEASLMNRLKHKSLVQSVESFIDQGLNFRAWRSSDRELLRCTRLL